MRENKLISEKSIQILPIISPKPSQAQIENRPASTSAVGSSYPKDS